MLRIAGVALLLGLALSGCGDASGPEDAELQRVLEPPAGSLSTASFTRVQIGSETRPVLSARPRVPLRWLVPVALGEALEVETLLPPDLASEELVRVDTWVSVRDTSSQDQTWSELRATDAGRETIRAAPVLVGRDRGAEDGGDGLRISASIPVPEKLRGMRGLLSTVARPLSPTPVERWEVGPLRVGRRARLAFGYGVEEPGWAEGWPPVHFRAHAQDAAGGPPSTLFERRIDPAADPRDRRWFDASVDLSHLAGRVVRVVFEAEALGEAPGAKVGRSFAVVSSPEVFVDSVVAEARPERPNLILVSIDTLRARNVGAYGYARDTSPTLDRRLAAQGALVREALTPRAYTPPART